MMTRFWAHTLGAIVAAVALGFSATPAQAAFTLNFDSLGNVVPIPNGYGGFNWDNFYSIDKASLPGTGYDLGNVSPNKSAFNAFGRPASITSTTLFTFNSTYLTAAWNNGLSIRVEGILGGATNYDQTVTVNTTGPTLFNFNYANIDTLRFTSSGGDPNLTHFVMDNATFDGDVNPTPAPAGIVLFGLGFAGMGMLRKFRKGTTVVA